MKIKHGYMIIAIIFLLTLLANFSLVSAAKENINCGEGVNSSTALLNDDVSINKSIVVIGDVGSAYTQSGSNESHNVILKFKISPASDPHLGGVSRVWVNINLYFKDNNTPIPNQIVYMVAGNKTFTYKTNIDGTIEDIFVPEIYGINYFQFSFNGSYINDNGFMVYLEPVSTYAMYFLNEPPIHIYFVSPPYHFPLFWPEGIFFNNVIDLDLSIYSKDININESGYSPIDNANKNGIMGDNNQLTYAELEKTGVPIILLILFLIAFLCIYGFKRGNI